MLEKFWTSKKTRKKKIRKKLSTKNSVRPGGPQNLTPLTPLLPRYATAWPQPCSQMQPLTEISRKNNGSFPALPFYDNLVEPVSKPIEIIAISVAVEDSPPQILAQPSIRKPPLKSNLQLFWRDCLEPSDWVFITKIL